MNILKTINYTALSVAIAGVLYLTHREFYNLGLERGNSAGQQAATRQMLENIDEKLMYCKTIDGKNYKMPRFEHGDTKTTESGKAFRVLELMVDCNNGEVKIPLKKVVHQNEFSGSTMW